LITYLSYRENDERIVGGRTNSENIFMKDVNNMTKEGGEEVGSKNQEVRSSK
jgi:hypothetical protein